MFATTKPLRPAAEIPLLLVLASQRTLSRINNSSITDNTVLTSLDYGGVRGGGVFATNVTFSNSYIGHNHLVSSSQYVTASGGEIMLVAW